MRVYILIDKHQQTNNGFVSIHTYRPACEHHKEKRELWFKKKQNKEVELEIVEMELIPIISNPLTH